jgi:hypothetical protein
MLLSYRQTAGENHKLKIHNISFENVANFKYLATTVTNQNLIRRKLRGD